MEHAGPRAAPRRSRARSDEHYWSPASATSSSFDEAAELSRRLGASSKYDVSMESSHRTVTFATIRRFSRARMEGPWGGASGSSSTKIAGMADECVCPSRSRMV